MEFGIGGGHDTGLFIFFFNLKNDISFKGFVNVRQRRRRDR
jgi:hypothetical protein